MKTGLLKKLRKQYEWGFVREDSQWIVLNKNNTKYTIPFVEVFDYPDFLNTSLLERLLSKLSSTDRFWSRVYLKFRTKKSTKYFYEKANRKPNRNR